MIDSLLSKLAPHHCYGCGKTGSLLCDDCKYNITSEKFSCCLACGGGAGLQGVCYGCNVPYERAWCVGERSGTLQQLIGGFKFQNLYGAYAPLAELLVDSLDELPAETVVIPVPTVGAHIRERGYDHTLLIARHIAKRRHLKVSQALHRVTNTKQRGVGRSSRLAQAKVAFRVKGKLKDDRPYLLIDDIVTTGATMYYAALALRDAGVKVVWVAAIARQPLD